LAVTEFPTQVAQNSWADEYIDEAAKTMLATREHGQYINVDIVSHMEYFYNTLGCSQAAENPFLRPDSFPALLYKCPNSAGSKCGVGSPFTLLEKHRMIIFPKNSTGPSFGAKGSGTTGQELSGMSVTSSQKSSNASSFAPIKYGWIPNSQIDLPSFRKNSFSPGPKKFSCFMKRGSALIVKPPLDDIIETDAYEALLQ